MITILDTIILFLISPFGFMLAMGALVYFEYVTIRSILKESYGINLKAAMVNYFYRHTSKLPVKYGIKRMKRRHIKTW